MPAPLRPSSLEAWAVAFDPAAELDWGEPVTSRRLLREHLDQSHDGASRRIPIVERHVSRLRRLLPAPPARLLDAACGPGFYAVRLGRAGYEVTGLDVGPAVLQHARRLARDARVPARFLQGDLRELAPPPEPFDAAVLVYYVLEGFPRAVQVDVLRRLAAQLRPGGRLIAELRTRPDQPEGRLAGWEVVAHSLLSDRRHLLLSDTRWDARRREYVLREVAVFDDGSVAAQQTTSALIPLSGVPSLFGRAGLRVVAVYDGWSRYRATGLSESLLVVAERPRSGRVRRTR